MDELKKLIEFLQKEIHEFKSANDRRLAEVETKGKASVETLTKVDEANSKISALEEQIRAVKTALARGAHGANAEESTEVREYKASFERFIRGSADATDIDRLRQRKAAQQISDNTLGGYLVTPEYGASFLKVLEEISPFRSFANVQTIGTGSIRLPNLESSDAEAEWEDEIGAARDGDQAFKAGLLTIDANALRFIPFVSYDLLSDTSYDVMGELQRQTSIKVAQKEGLAFHSGNGAKRPRGFLTYPATAGSGTFVQQVITGDAADITADAFHTIEGEMKTAYKAGARYFANRKTIAAMRKLKDANDRYLLQWDFSMGSPMTTLNGYQVVEDTDMPDIGAGTLPVAFANFAEGYQIVDNRSMTFEQLPRGFRNQPDLAYWYFRKRVGGAVRIGEAIKLLKVANA